MPPLPNPTVKLLRVPEASERLGVSSRKVFRLIAMGALRSVRVGMRGTRIPEQALTEYVAALPAAR